MRHVVETKRADRVAKGDLVLVPLSGAGLLVARRVTGVVALDGRKWVEIETGDGLRRLASREDLVVVLGPERRKGRRGDGR